MEILETRRLILRPVTARDADIISKWESSDDYAEFVSSKSNARYHLKFLICLKKTGEPVGTIYTFSYNHQDGYMFLNVFVDKRKRSKGYGAEASILLICHLFKHFPIYKMYIDSFSINTQSISMIEGAGFEMEGYLKGHRLYRGKRYDVIRFAVYRENTKNLERLLEGLKRERV